MLTHAERRRGGGSPGARGGTAARKGESGEIESEREREWRNTGGKYWDKMVKKRHIPTPDEWKIIELEILKMRERKNTRLKFHFVKLSEINL